MNKTEKTQKKVMQSMATTLIISILTIIWPHLIGLAIISLAYFILQTQILSINYIKQEHRRLEKWQKNGKDESAEQ